MALPSVGGARQGHAKADLFTIPVGRDLAAVRLDQLLDNGQPDAGAAVFAGARFLSPVEALENEGQIPGYQLGGGVAEFDLSS